MRRSSVVLLVLVLTGTGFLACRSPKKVLTERDKQQVKDSLLAQPPSGEDVIEVNANFEDKVKLLAYSVNKHRVKPGETIALTLYWEALAPVEGDFKIFVHLDSTKARKTYDHYAIGGLYPTANWVKGEIIKDELPLVIDNNFPTGPAKLWLGFFDAAAWKNERKNVRLSVKDAGAVRADKQDRLLVTAFMVGDVDEKSLAVKKTDADITIDGKPTEAAWTQAFASAGGFYTPDGKALPDKEKVDAGILWDDENLYFAFRVKDQDIRSPYTQRDSTLWSGGRKGASDVVEIFLDPGADSRKYLELQVSPANVVFDAIFDGYRDPAWKKAAEANLNVRHAVDVQGTLNQPGPDQGYTLEVAIPWKELPGLDGPPQPGQSFALNFYRLSNSGTWAGAWSPVGNDFHDLNLAGRVTFVQ